MSGIRNRIDDAIYLWKQGRQEGAFLSALTAVAAAKPPVELPFNIGEVQIKGEKRWNELGQVGYLKNGNLAVANNRGRPADDSDLLLYEFDNGEWKSVKQRYCDRFDICRFDDISGREWSDWREEAQMYHPMVSLNPFVVDRGKVKDLSTQFFSEKTGADWRYIKFSVNGHESILYYDLRTESELGFALYSGSYYFKIDKDNKPVSKHWYDTSIEDKYLLYRGPHGVLGSIDLETGEAILSDMEFAFWIY